MPHNIANLLGFLSFTLLNIGVLQESYQSCSPHHHCISSYSELVSATLLKDFTPNNSVIWSVLLLFKTNRKNI